MGLFDKIKKLNIFSGLFSIDEDFFEELEEALILSDMGVDTSTEAVDTLRERVKANKIKDPEAVSYTHLGPSGFCGLPPGPAGFALPGESVGWKGWLGPLGLFAGCCPDLQGLPCWASRWGGKVGRCV